MATSISTQPAWHVKYFARGLSLVVCVLGLFNLYLFFTGAYSYLILFAGSILLASGIGIFKSVTSSIHNITITQQGVSEKLFNSQVNYTWSDIDRIELTGKQRFKYSSFFNTPSEAATIYLKNGERIILWYSLYQNMSSICTVLQRAANILKNNGSFDELDFTITTNRAADVSSVSENSRVYYTGLLNNYAESAVLLIWPLFGVLTFIAGCYRLIENIMPVSKFLLPCIALVILSGLMTYLFAKRFNYIIIDKDCLIVKNKLYAKWQYNYALDNIKLMVIEEPYNMPHSIRIITKQFENKIYPAGCLNKKKLGEFIAAMEQQNVPLRNDIEHFDYL